MTAQPEVTQAMVEAGLAASWGDLRTYTNMYEWRKANLIAAYAAMWNARPPAPDSTVQRFVDSQQPLGEEFAKALHGNMSKLLDDEPAPGDAEALELVYELEMSAPAHIGSSMLGEANKQRKKAAVLIRSLLAQRDELKSGLATQGGLRANIKRYADALEAEMRSVERLKQELTAARAEVAALKRDAEWRGKQLDALLNHCPDMECSECGRIMCPEADTMHFHHDGCPSCSMPVIAQERK